MFIMVEKEMAERFNLLLYRNGNIVRKPTKNLKKTKLLYSRYSFEILALVHATPHVSIARAIRKKITLLFDNMIKEINLIQSY